MITPNTNIRLLKVPFEIARKNQLTFASLNAQTTYFLSLPHLEYDNTTYQRANNTIRFEAPIDYIRTYNYVMYKNESYSDKWFYAYIIDMEYKNDNTTDIKIQQDSFQTWQFNIIYKKMFVEREHVNDDTIGLNIIDENLQLGEYTCNKKHQWLHEDNSQTPYDNSDMVIMIGATSQKDKTHNTGVQTDGIYAGLRYYGFHNNGTGISALNSWLEEYAQNGISEAIKCMFMIPEYLSGGSADRQDHLYAGSNLTIKRYINHDTSSASDKTIDLALDNLDGYVPVNNKLRTFPYSYLLASNNSGTDIIYRYENFFEMVNNVKTLINPKFTIESCLTPSGSIRIIPNNYKGVENNDIEGFNLGKFPICNWDTDVYTNWLTQNGVNIGLQVVGSTISTATGIATGNPIGVASGILGIAQTLGEIYKESLVPPQSEGNINCGDVVSASGNNDFHFHVMSIKNNQARIIDNFFSAFGYKVNSFKIPNITGRTNWNYVKTMDCNITGEIPQEDLQELKDMFDNGVTFWHNPSTFLDYSQSNAIVT